MTLKALKQKKDTYNYDNACEKRITMQL